MRVLRKLGTKYPTAKGPSNNNIIIIPQSTLVTQCANVVTQNLSKTSVTNLPAVLSSCTQTRNEYGSWNYGREWGSWVKEIAALVAPRVPAVAPSPSAP